MEKKYFKSNTSKAPLSGAVLVGNTLYISGQLGVDPATGKMAEGGIAAQTDQAMKNLGDILAKAGFGYKDVVKTMVWVLDVVDVPKLNEVYDGYWGEDKPGRSCVQAAFANRQALVEIEAIAVKVE